MGKISEFFSNPGSRPDSSDRAPISLPAEDAEHASKFFSCEVSPPDSSSDESTLSGLGKTNVGKNGHISTSHGFTGLQKSRTDRMLDKAVQIAGSQIIFGLMWIIIIIWIVVGIVFKAPENWQVVMQDGQSIQSYFWDTLLMRQQLISANDHVHICAVLRSRIRTFKRLCVPKSSKNLEKDARLLADSTTYEIQAGPSDLSGTLPAESWYDRLSSFAGRVIGSLPFMTIFWAGIFVWIGCGAIPLDAGNTPPYTGRLSGANPEMKKFSDSWQLYINTATAVVLLVCTMFLQNTRARHDKYIAKALAAVFDVDEEIEQCIRGDSGDFSTPNEIITIPSKKRTIGEKVIDWYADVIGTGIGLFIAVAAIATWLGVGHLMNWSSNWWLIIGTYTGLIGFLDGFVLRQVYLRVVKHEQENYDTVAEEDMELFQHLGIHCPEEFVAGIQGNGRSSLPLKISVFINKVCSSQWSVAASVIIIIGLIAVASGLHWSTTGQLLANTPTMIIEAFFLIVLIQAHNWADQRRRVDVSALFARRCILLAHVKADI